MKALLQKNKILLLLIAVVVVFYADFAYSLERANFIKLFGLYSVLFFLSYKIFQIYKWNFWGLAGIAFLFRIVFIAAIPNLSQDFYRFIWDGRMFVAGWNPYLYLPEDIIVQGNAPIFQARELFNGMGGLNASHYTNYPPLNQLIFAMAGLVSGKSMLGAVITMRVFIIAADIGTLYFGKKLLEAFYLPISRIYLYILNPFVIIELTGNLHFEGVMVFLLVFSLYLLHFKKWMLSAVMIALSISLKLLPLIFLPLLFGYFTKQKERNSLSFGKLLLYYAITGLVVMLSFLPFLSAELISNFASSIGLWFQKFEFNASIYYIIRWIGFQIKGYNIIGIVGKLLPVAVICVILALTFLRKNSSTQRLIVSSLLAVTTYFFLSTTVHPWYIATPLILSVFTRYRFAVIWSFFSILSYYAYSSDLFKENLWLVALEYVVVMGVFCREVFTTKENQKPLFGL
ncbi:mannosyltransferase [Gillisia sp. M10.2A]|uniref:Mannosyltransferase n=1 Tax=Gillisia lutea TaxID=2909668 RepID=A0ABS9ED42_9FLAO|nr:mannosyltransferase [Gillisia lutea]MCF4100805.1 mannosyltransferase [Gillisia lutea]